jgi:hypothetical protein
MNSILSNKLASFINTPNTYDIQCITTINEPLTFSRKLYKVMEYEKKLEVGIDIKTKIFGKMMIERFSDYCVLTINDFEYCKPQNMKQYILWTFDNNLTHETVKDLIKQYISDKQYMIFTLYQTPYTSIKSIKHFHIILRDKEERKLKKVIMIARHGPRTPLINIPKLSWDNKIHGELTEQGELYCEQFGRKINRIYESYINLSDNIVCESGCKSRVIKSAECVLRGITSKKIDINKIPLLYGDTNLTDDEFKILDEKRKRCGTLDIELNKIIYNILGYDVKYPYEYYDIHTTLQCYIADNRSLPSELTSDIIKQT